MNRLVKTAVATALMATSLTAMASSKVVTVDVITASTGYEKVEFDPRDIGLSPNIEDIKQAMVEAGANEVTENGYVFEVEEGKEFTINDTYIFPFDHKDYKRGLEFTTSVIDADPQGQYLSYDITYSAVVGMEDLGYRLDLHILEHNIKHKLYIEDNTVVSFDINDMKGENNKIENQKIFVVFNIEDK